MYNYVIKKWSFKKKKYVELATYSDIDLAFNRFNMLRQDKNNHYIIQQSLKVNKKRNDN